MMNDQDRRMLDYTSESQASFVRDSTKVMLYVAQHEDEGPFHGVKIAEVLVLPRLREDAVLDYLVATGALIRTALRGKGTFYRRPRSFE